MLDKVVKLNNQNLYSVHHLHSENMEDLDKAQDEVTTYIKSGEKIRLYGFNRRRA